MQDDPAIPPAERRSAAASAPLTRRAVLGLGVLGAGLAAVTWRVSSTGRAGPGTTLTAPQAHAQAASGGITLVDIRRPSEWEATGIGQGAHPIDMRRPDFTDALLTLTQGSRTQPVALICARGVRSARLARRLAEAGFVRIIDVPEGMVGSAAGPGWLARGLPVDIYEGA